MRMRLCAIGVACQFAGLLLTSSVRADVGVQFSAGLEIQSANDFYQPLQGYGEWVSLPQYGRCWRPVSVARDWRPYEVGYWEWTDCGWYWESSEPWAWACYHYGGWEFEPSYGWVWIPGTEWAPAWVTWREGGDYIGWAPCGPGGIALSASFFGFVDLHHFHDHFRHQSFVVNNATIVNRTSVINQFDRETRNIGGRSERVVINRGPDVKSIQRSTGKSFRARPITQVVEQTAIPSTVRTRSDTQIRHRTLNEASAPRRNGNRNNNSRDYGQGSGARDLNRGSATSPGAAGSGSYQNDQGTLQEQRKYQPQPNGSAAVAPNTPDRQPAAPQNRTVTPTGRESTRTSNPARNYETQPSQPPQTPPHQAIPGSSTRPQQPSATQQRPVTPTGRDQNRVLEQQSSTPSATPPSPANSRTVESRPQSSTSSRNEAGEENRSSLPASVREKPIAPTGRESQRNYESAKPAEPAHAAPSAPPREEAPRAESHPEAAQPHGDSHSDNGKRDKDH